MKRLLEGSVPEITNSSTSIDINMFVRDFSRLTLKLPFVVNICGIVSTIGEEVMTQSGKPMASFRLHDASGRCCDCKILGRHVGNTFLQEGCEVILFGMTAQSGLGRSCGSLWVYDHTHIIRLRERVPVPPAKETITFEENM